MSPKDSKPEAPTAATTAATSDTGKKPSPPPPKAEEHSSSSSTHSNNDNSPSASKQQTSSKSAASAAAAAEKKATNSTAPHDGHVVEVADQPVHTVAKQREADNARRLQLYGSRALAAGGKRQAQQQQQHAVTTTRSPSHRAHALTSFGARRNTALGQYIQQSGDLSTGGKYLVVGDGLMAPFMALCLRTHGLGCDLAHHPSTSDMDRGTIVLTPSVTQLMGDVLNVSVPSGSVVGRILTFDHVGNDMCDIDLNEFREKGESPTFFCCDRLKVEAALLSLCSVGTHSCHLLPKAEIDKGGLEALDNGGVRVRFASGLHQDYLGVICTARNQDLVPELTISNEELQQRAENAEKFKETYAKAVRWLEVCVPPLPELGKYEKRFTPGSQEIVELLTPRDAKMTVRPTMMATKLFYNVSLTIPDGTSDPRLKSTSTKQFWDDVIQHWTAGVPGYVSHTMFRPMFTHMQQNFTKSSALVYRSPIYLMPHWTEGGGRVVKIAHAAHGSCFDAVDIADAQGFSDCFGLARAIAAGEDVTKFLKERRLQVMEELDHHARLTQYGIKERGQMAYMASRFNMKILRKYKGSWRAILQNYVSLMPKVVR